MLINIRRGVFETNSSSTHSITICPKNEYNKWKNGELFLDDEWRADKQFLTKEEAIEKLKRSGYYDDYDFNDEIAVEELLNDNDIEIYTAEKYFKDEYLEIFEAEYTTPNGEEIIAFGQYGYQG